MFLLIIQTNQQSTPAPLITVSLENLQTLSQPTPSKKEAKKKEAAPTTPSSLPIQTVINHQKNEEPRPKRIMPQTVVPLPEETQPGLETSGSLMTPVAISTPSSFESTKNKVVSELESMAAKTPSPVTATTTVPPLETVNLNNANLEPYFLSLRQKILSRITYPPLARRHGWQGVVRLYFSLERSGRIRQIEVLEGSGYPLLDQSALNSLRQMNPFPAFPESINPNEFAFTITIRYRLE